MSDLFPPLSLGPQAPQHDVDFVVEGLLPYAYLTILAAEPKTGKTAFATALAFAVATGQPFLGREVEQGPVLWLSLEEGPDERAALLKHLSDQRRQHIHANPVEGMEPGQVPIYVQYQFPPIDTQRGISELEWIFHQLMPKLVVIDSLHACQSGRSLTDGWAARKTLQGLKRFSGPKAPAILVLHHLGGTRYRRRVAESAQLAATASMLWLLEQVPTPEGEGRWFHLECRGRGNFANRHLHLKSPTPLEYETYEVEHPKPVEKIPNPIDAMIMEAVGSVEKALTAGQIADLVGQNYGTVRNAIRRLLHKGELRASSIVSGARRYKKVAVNNDASSASSASLNLR
jgi:hypothetical protein